MSYIFVQIMTQEQEQACLTSALFIMRSFYKLMDHSVKFLKPEKSESGLYNLPMHSVTQNFIICILFLITISILILLWNLHITKHLHVMAIHTSDI